MEIKIGNMTITNEGRPYFIADIAANHDGDINLLGQNPFLRYIQMHP